MSHDEDGDDVEAEDEAVELVVPDVHVDRVQLDVDGLQVGQDGDSQLESGEQNEGKKCSQQTFG